MLIMRTNILMEGSMMGKSFSHLLRHIDKLSPMIGSKITPNNLFVTDIWRAYEKYANE